MDTIQDGSITEQEEQIDLILNNTYLAIKQNVSPESMGEVEQFKLIQETRTSYKFKNITDPKYTFDVWYIKTAIITTGDLHNNHALKIIEDVTNEAQGKDTST